MAQAVPNLCVNRKVFLKHQVNWNTVGGVLPWRNIWSADNPVEVLNEHLSLLIGRYVPTKVIRVRNNDKPWFDDEGGGRVRVVDWSASLLVRLICCQIILIESCPGSLLICRHLPSVS